MSLDAVEQFSQGCMVAQYHLKIYSDGRRKRKEQLGENSHAFFSGQMRVRK